MPPVEIADRRGHGFQLPLSRFRFYLETGGITMSDATGTENEALLREHELNVIGGIIESKSKYRKVVQAAIAQWVKDFQAQRIELRTVDDLRKLIEMDIELQKDEF